LQKVPILLKAFSDFDIKCADVTRNLSNYFITREIKYYEPAIFI